MKKLVLVGGVLLALGLGSYALSGTGRFCVSDCGGPCSAGSSNGQGCGCGGIIVM